MAKHSSNSSLNVMFTAAPITKCTQTSQVLHNFSYIHQMIQKHDIIKMPLGVALKTQQVIVSSALHPFPLLLTHMGALKVFHANIVAH